MPISSVSRLSGLRLVATIIVSASLIGVGAGLPDAAQSSSTRDFKIKTELVGPPDVVSGQPTTYKLVLKPRVTVRNVVIRLGVTGNALRVWRSKVMARGHTYTRSFTVVVPLDPNKGRAMWLVEGGSGKNAGQLVGRGKVNLPR